MPRACPRTQRYRSKPIYCFDPYDLCAAKLFAFRDKDIRYVKSLLDSGVIEKAMLIERITSTPNHEQKKQAALNCLG
jgi:hypothetical protein